ncbi:hypothetical protein OC861_003371 [Tilletia horrida]|nr:hypothetical protein OC861_003371 [Tilletia horrida]
METMDMAIPPDRDPSQTFTLHGHALQSSIEQYAVLGPEHFRFRLTQQAKEDYKRLGLSEERPAVRELIKKELDRRANGQGHLFHNPKEGTVYDPSLPFREGLSDEEMAELQHIEGRRLAAQSAAAAAEREQERRLAYGRKRGWEEVE